jgi:nicotinamidase/pyrazinamidase
VLFRSSLPPEKLAAEYEQLIFPKHTFSVFTNPHFGRLVEAIDVGEYVVFGVALDYCVREVTLGLLERGRKVTIVGDAVRAITLAGAEETTRLLTQRGARWATTDDIIR